ncbi:hypothetical protein [Ascidiaceihabitans sp.]|uniref:hypothetical protein n=1 Tax=Ascidiaceihabitans sp. TaxID=1872644 RepID=UPI00329A4373
MSNPSATTKVVVTGRINAGFLERNFEGKQLAKVSKKTASIQYRYVKTEDLFTGFDLQDVLVDILRRSSGADDPALSTSVRLRKKDLDQDGSFFVLNQMSNEATWDGPVFCGQIIHVKKGVEIPGINGTVDQDIPSLKLANFSVGKENSIVDGILYFAIAGNHVGLIEGQKARGRSLERFLTSMLQDAEELEPGEAILLPAKIQGKLPEIRSMKLLPKRSAAQSASNRTKQRSLAEAKGNGATVFEVLELLGWNHEEIGALSESVPEGGWIEGAFNVLFKHGKSRAAINRKAIEEAVRNLDNSSIGLVGNGSEKGGHMKLSEPRSIECTSDMLNPDAAMQAIVKVMKKWAQLGHIDCDFNK